MPVFSHKKSITMIAVIASGVISGAHAFTQFETDGEARRYAAQTDIASFQSGQAPRSVAHGRHGGSGGGDRGGSSGGFDLDPSRGFSASRARESLARMSVALDLDEDQQSKVREIIKGTEEKAQPIVRKTARMRRRLMMLDVNADDFAAQRDALAQDIAEGVEALLIMSVELRAQVVPLLTEGQRKKLAELASGGGRGGQDRGQRNGGHDHGGDDDRRRSNQRIDQ